MRSLGCILVDVCVNITKSILLGFCQRRKNFHIFPIIHILVGLSYLLKSLFIQNFMNMLSPMRCNSMHYTCYIIFLQRACKCKFFISKPRDLSLKLQLSKHIDNISKFDDGIHSHHHCTAVKHNPYSIKTAPNLGSTVSTLATPLNKRWGDARATTFSPRWLQRDSFMTSASSRPIQPSS